MHYALKDYGAELKWNVGTLFCHDYVLFKMLNLCRKYSIPCPVRWAFGCIPSPMASGMVLPSVTDFRDAEEIVLRHVKEGIACRLTLNNPHINQKMIDRDIDTAKLLKLLNDTPAENGERHGVVVASDAMARHVRECYPELEVILSVVVSAYDVGYGIVNDTLEWYEERLSNPLYDIVEVNNSKAYEDSFLDAMPERYISRIELIACRNCIRNCPFTKHHFEAALGVMREYQSTKNLEKSKLMLREVEKMCLQHRKQNLDKASSYSEEMIRKLAGLGYFRFQLSVRMNDDDRVEKDLEEYLFNYRHLRYLENLG